ncbi:MAG: hypothetical protein IPL32_19840 [Chloracidobacterium sp.]|nr:hypothetical protein [Chloracidobacterium sp.]
MSDRPLMALTVHPPWSGMIAAGLKPVENRSWPPPPQLIGQRLAIHAGKSLDSAALQVLGEHQELLGIPDGALDHSLARSAIVAVVTLRGAVRVADADRPDETLTPLQIGQPRRLRPHRILGGLPTPAALDAIRSPWAMGPWLWVLGDVQAIDPVPCQGAQKVWRVPDGAAAAVLEQLRGKFRTTPRRAIPGATT